MRDREIAEHDAEGKRKPQNWTAKQARADIHNGIPIPTITVRMTHANPRPLGIISRTEIPEDSGNSHDCWGISAATIDPKFIADWSWKRLQFSC